MISRTTHYFVAGLVFAGLALSSNASLASSSDTEDKDNFRSDVLHCEDALRRLSQCCPSFDAQKVQCEYYDHQWSSGGCDDSSGGHVHTEPALHDAESACIMQSSCDALVANGVCERAQAAVPYGSSSSYDDSTDKSDGYDYGNPDNGSTSSSHAPVCP